MMGMMGASQGPDGNLATSPLLYLQSDEVEKFLTLQWWNIFYHRVL